MENITPDQIDALKAANPGAELHLLSNEAVGFEVVVKTPTWAQWRQYRLRQADPEQRAGANKELVAMCLVKPTAVEFEAMLNERPALADTISMEIGEVAGLSNATTRKKL